MKPTLLTSDVCPLCAKVKAFLCDLDVEYMLKEIPGGKLNLAEEKADPTFVRFLTPLLDGGGRFPVLVFSSSDEVSAFVNMYASPFVRRRINPSFWWLSAAALGLMVGENCADGACRIS